MINKTNLQLTIITMTQTVHDITDNNIKLSLLSMKINGIETIITNILTQLQSILTAHYKLHKLNDMLTLASNYSI